MFSHIKESLLTHSQTTIEFETHKMKECNSLRNTQTSNFNVNEVTKTKLPTKLVHAVYT